MLQLCIINFNIKKTNKMKNTVLISGVTGAIGGAAALEIANTGANVVLLARNKSKLEQLKKDIVQKSGNNDIDILVADLSEIASIKNATKEFKQKYGRLDALVNVAAIYSGKREMTKDNLESMFAVNHVAPFILANELIGLLKESKGRVVTVSAPSTTKLNFDDLQGEQKFSALTVFGASKMMNLMFTYSLARRLEGTGVSATVLHPGVVKSNLTDEMPAILKFIFGLIAGKPDAAAKMLSALAVNAQYENTNGKFFKYNGKEMKSSTYSYDENLQEKLWTLTEKIVKTVSLEIA
jgi:NAD(P)-dependent dehydrogenase (short-subunit alcohol dehydrogenase family)